MPFTPRAGMRFKVNDARVNRIITLVNSESGGATWIAETASNRKIRIRASRLHTGAYHDGWSLIDALPEKFGEVVKDERSETNTLIMRLAEIRQALGVGNKPMLDELPKVAAEIRQGFDRYQKMRRLTPAGFAKIWRITFKDKSKFDTLIDNLNLPN